MSNNIDPVALAVLLADPNVDPATAVAGSIVDEPEPPAPWVASPWFAVGFVAGGLLAVIYFLVG
jgi:hypothetical protein